MMPGGAYVVTARLPADRAGEFKYRIKSANKIHERAVLESQLKASL